MTLPSVPDSACAAHRAYRAHPLHVPAAARRAGVQVVRVDFDWQVPLASPAYAALSDAERARAGRFLRSQDAVRSAGTRVALRDVLGAQLGIAPQAVALVVGEAGRPALDPAHHSSLDFNVSHAGDHALIAWSAGCRVGVDIERCDRATDWRGLTREVCTPGEAAYLDALPDPARADAFMHVWSAKEALLKALGTGIGGGLRAFAVVPPRDAATPAVEVVSPAAPAAGVAGFDAAWLDAAPGYAACVAWTRA
ncbi:4'-phosphopantetheinyl transferase family protein [Burkholderia ubonensis]|uniref:4'-phosphopantetheinyl transferase family protein n=1 Tax=Burkholderia ubonensis TaxID=101571 RepID=UPI002AB2226E|nr:4'-phosphopantetheinyl transferase superfamily protein [Burkholderia ubonensis]